MQPQPVYSMLHPAQKPYFTVRCSPLASSVKLSFPPFYQPHPGEEMREKTTSRAVRRMCTSCRLSARSLLRAGITALLRGGASTAALPGAPGCVAEHPGGVCILPRAHGSSVQPRLGPVPTALASPFGCSPVLSLRPSHISLRCQE